MKKLLRVVKLLPLFFMGVALIVWTSVFQRGKGPGEKGATDFGTSSDDVIFPY